MKHYIIVKFNENVEKDKLINPIKELFQNAMYIKEVIKVDILDYSNKPNYNQVAIFDLN